MKAFLFDSSAASRLNFLGFDSTMRSLTVKEQIHLKTFHTDLTQADRSIDLTHNALKGY